MSESEKEKEAREFAINEVVRFLKKPGSSATLMGRAIDVGKDAGKREFAEWFTELVFEMDDWFEENPPPEESTEFVLDASIEDEDDRNAGRTHVFEDPELAGFDHHAHCAGANYEHLFPGVCPRLEEL